MSGSLGRFASALACCAAIVAGTANSGATTYYWDSDANSGNGINDGPGTWTGQGMVTFNTIPLGSEAPAGTADTVIFGNGGVGGVVTLGGAISVNKLEFGSNSTTGYTLSATSAQILTIGSGGIVMDSGAQNATVGNASLTIALGALAAETFRNNSANLLTIGGPITDTGNFLLTLNAASTGGITLAGAITGGPSSGVLVTSTGTGAVTLSGANTYTGATTIQSGALVAGSNVPASGVGAFGNSAGAIALGNATTISSNLSPTLLTGGAFTIARAITVGSGAGGSGTYTIGGNTANASTISGAVTLNQSLRVTQVAGGTLNLTGSITGTAQTLTFNNAGAVNATGVFTLTGGVRQTGAGVTTFSNIGNNVYTGGTTLTAGTLSIALQQHLGAAGSGLTFDGGTLQITGSQIQSFTGALPLGHTVTFNAGKPMSLDIATSTNIFTADRPLLAGTVGVTKLGAGTLVLSQANSYTGQTTLSAGTLSVATPANLGAAGTNLVFDGGTLQIMAGGTLATTISSFSGTASPGIALGHAVTFNPGKTVGLAVSNGNTFTVDTPLNLGTGGFTIGSLDLTYNGTVILGAASAPSYTGTTTVSNGILQLTAANLFTGAPLPALTVTGGAFDILSNNESVGAVTITGGQILGSGGTLTGTSYSVQAGTITANLGGSGTLTKTGAAQAALSGTNTYTGGTILSAGTLSITTAANLGGPTSGLVFDGGTLQIGTGSALTSFASLGRSSITFNAGKTVGLAVSDSGTTFVAGLPLNQTTGGFTKDGLGTVTLNSANTYTGVTNVKLGTLRAGVASVANVSGAFGNNSAIVMANANATLDLAGFSTQIGSLTGGGPGVGNVLLGSATLTVGGDNTSPALYAGNISGVIGGGGAGSLVKIGTGTLTLSGNNSYTGSTTVNGGTLVLDHGLHDTAKLSPTAALILGTGTLQLDRAVGVGFPNSTAEIAASTLLTGVANVTRPDTTSQVELFMGFITQNPGASINFDASGIAHTTTPNDSSGILGSWATIGGTDFAVNSGVSSGLIVAFTGYFDVTRRNDPLGTQIIPNDSTANVRIIEGDITTAVAPLTLAGGLGTTTINTLNQTATGGIATIDMGAGTGGTLALNGILVSAGASGLTIGNVAGNGKLMAASAGGELSLQTLSTDAFTINSSIVNNTSASKLTIAGTGTVVLAANNNSYSGSTGFSGGTVSLTGSLTGGTAITVSGAAILSEATTGVISGAASITHSSSGTSFLFGPNTYTGKTNITGGAIVINVENGLGIPTSSAADQLTLNGGALLATSTFTFANVNRGITLGASGGTFGATIGDTVTITTANPIIGSGGLTLIGFGALSLVDLGVLAPGSNTFTGPTVINGGSLIINSAAALGLPTAPNSKIFINGSITRAAGGGSLVLAGGVSLSRDIDIMGLGPTSDLGAPIISVRNNTLSGIVSRSTVNTNNTRVYSAGGLLQFTGTLNLTGTALSQFITFGGINAVGLSNYSITGTLSGTGSLQKSSAGTLILDPANSASFSGTIRVSGGSTMRILKDGVLGSRTGPLAANTGVNSVLDMNTGILEVRMDTPLITAGGSPALVYGRGSSTFFVDHAPSGTAIKGTATFGTFTTQAGGTYVLNGRNGYGVTFADTPINGGSSVAFTNNLNGYLTLNGDAWSTVDATARTMTIQGNGETFINGYILASGADHFVTKTGSGVLTLTASTVGSSTFRGATNINGGTLATGDIKNILNQGTTGTIGSNNAINVGSGGTTAAFSYTGAGETTPAVFNLAGTTGSGIILANQSGTALTFSSAIAASGAGAKNLILGGSATGSIINQIQGVIQDNAAANKTSLLKAGLATWLYAPAPLSFGAGVATTTGSTLGAAQTNTITINGSSSNITVGEKVTAGGTNVPVGAVVTNVLGNTITLSSNIGGAIANNTAITFGAATSFTGNLTVVGGTLQVQPTAASGTGSLLFGSAQVLTFAADTATFGNQWAGGTFELATPSVTMSANLAQTLGALTLTAGAGKVQVDSGNNGKTNTLNFASLGAIGAGATVDLAPNASLATITFTAAPAITNGVIGNDHVFFNGADFATVSVSPFTALAASYTTKSTLNSLATIATPTLIGGSFSNGAVTVRAGIKFASAQTLSMTGLLTLNNGANTSGGILVTGTTSASPAIINGVGGITTAGTGDLVIRTNTANDTLNLGTLVTATTTGGITKAGLGTLILNAANAETGTFTIDEGTVQLGSAAAQLGANNLKLTIRQGGSLDFNGITPGNSLDALVGGGTILNSVAAPVTMTIGNNNTGGLFSGTISDTGLTGKLSIIKAGNGTEAFTGPNTFTGFVRIDAGTSSTGTLQVTTLADIGKASGIGKGDATTPATNAASLVFNGGTLQYTGDTTTGNNIWQATQTPSISIDRLFTLLGNGTIDSSGTYGNSIASGRVANNAALIFNNAAGSVAFSGAGARTLTLTGDSTGDNTMGIQLIDNPGGGALSVIKSGAGLWVLGNGANAYSGATTVNAGTLRVGASLPSSSNLVINGGIVESAGTFTRTLGPTGLNTVNWMNGGFAAAGAPLLVSITNGAGPIPTWNSATTPNFVLGSMTLSSATALAEVNIQSGFAITPGSTTGISVTTTGASPIVNTFGGSTTVGLAVGQSFAPGSIGNLATVTIASIVSPTQFTLSTGTGITAGSGTATPLAGGYREIIVNDNTNTNTDVATISGSISGSGVLRKSGAGILQLLVPALGTGSTYTGQTQVTTGVLVVNKLGLSSPTGTGTSVGISDSASKTSAGAIMLGNGSTGAAILQYVGAGETSDRMISLFTTTGKDEIHADGSGPLILTNVTNIASGVTAPGAKTLDLRGSNAQANQITNTLTDNGGALSIIVDGAATWVLGGTGNASTYTGGTTINTGVLGIGSSSASTTTGPLGGGPLNLTAGILFAYGADRSIANPITGAGFTFIGDYSLTFTGTYTSASAGMTTTNNIGQNGLLPGKSLFFGNVTFTAPGAGGTWTINGTGDTAVQGTIQNTTGTLNLAFNPATPADKLTLAGVNTYNGATTLQNGITILAGGSDNHLPATTKLTLGNGANSAILQLGDPVGGASNVTITSPSSVTLNGLGQVTASTNGPVVTIAGTGTKNAILGGSPAISSFAVYVNSVLQPFPSTAQQMAQLPSNLLLGTSNAVTGPVGYEANLRLVKVGPGTLDVSGTRYYQGAPSGSTVFYTGGTDVGTVNGIDGGVLNVSSSFYFGGNGAPATLLNVYGGTAELNGTIQSVSNLNLGGGAAGSTAAVNISGTLTVTGDITYNWDATLPSPNKSRPTSPNPATIGGTGSLSFQPSTGFTVISVGTSTAGSGVGAPDLTISSAIDNNTVPIHKEGPGTLRMVPNPNTQWGGDIVLNGGTLVLDGTAAANVGNYPILAPGKNLTVNKGTTLNLGATEGDVLSLGTVTVLANTHLVFNLGAPNPAGVSVTSSPGTVTSDFLDLTGGVLVLDGSTNNGKKVDINKLPTGFASGVSLGNPVHYTLLSANQVQDVTSGLAITPSNSIFALGTTPGGFQYNLHFDAVTGGADLILDVSFLLPDFFWKGGIDSKWSSVNNLTSTSNWVNAASGTAYALGAPGIANNVTFSANSPLGSPARQATTTVDIDMGANLLTINDSAVATINGSNGTILTLAGGMAINAGSVTFGGAADPNPALDKRLFIGVNSPTNSQSWKNNGSGTLTISNQVFSAATGGVQQILFDTTGSGTNDIVIDGNVIDGGLGGTIQLAQASTKSKLTLTNPANAYSGGTIISAGTLAFSPGALPAGGPVTFNADGTLQWRGPYLLPLGANSDDVSDRLKIASGAIGTLDVGANTVTFTKQLQAGPANLTSGTLNKAGSGTLVMAAPYDVLVGGGYNGGTTITQGTLEFVAGAFYPANPSDPTQANIKFIGNSTLRWSAGNTEDVSDRLRIKDGVEGTLDTNGNNVTFGLTTIQNGNPSTGSLKKAGLGTLTLATNQKLDATVAPAGYSGGTTIFDGTLEFVSGALPASGPITFSNTAGSSTATLRWISNADDISRRLQIQAGVTGTLDTNGNDVTFGVLGTVGAGMGSANLVGQRLSPGTLTKDGAGTLTMAEANPNFTGAMNILAGTVEFVPGALPGTGVLGASPVTFTGSTTLRWLPGAGSVNNADDLSSRLAIPAGITGTVDTGANSVTFASPMPTSQGDMVKTGTGTLTFSALSNPNFTGGINIASGTVIVTGGGLSGTKAVSVAQGAALLLQGTTSGRVNPTASVTMGAGSSGVPAILQINQVSETMGVFTLAGNSVIDFGTADNNAQLKFANSAAAPWTGSLSIFNWTANPTSGPNLDQLYFGLDSGGLTPAQLSAISFFSDPNGANFLGNATFAAGGEVVPVPEPTGLVALFSGTGVLLALRRRRAVR